MSYSDPVKTIDHIPQDFDMKRIAQQNVEPFSCERPGRVWTLITFIGALSIIAGALITGAWNE